MPVSANGPLKKLIGVLLMLVVVVVGMTLWTPFEAGYQVKIAAKTACNRLLMDTRNGMADKRSWEQPFLSTARKAGVVLKPEQYAFSVKVGNKNVPHTCQVLVRWRSSTPWFFIDDYGDIPHLNQIHELDFEHVIKSSY